jgi:thiol-disulfide isomerase/thioredoxin
MLAHTIGFSQIADGTVLEENIVSLDINDTTVDLFAMLDDGKSVIVDVYATWCGPCWTIHQEGILETLYDEYGPEGTDQIRVIAAESDGTTTMADLLGETAATQGNWVEGVPYTILDDAAWAGYFGITYYPSIFVVRPNRTVVHMYGDDLRQNIGNFAFWDRALGVAGLEDDMYVTGAVASEASCEVVDYTQSLNILNLGTEAITEATVDVYLNDVLTETITIDQEIPVFGSANVTSGTIAIEETTSITVESSTVNGTEIADDFKAIFEGDVYLPVVEEYSFLLKVTTDFYSLETSGNVMTDAGEVIFEFGDYATGPENFGGGGEDSNVTHEYEVTLPFPQVDVNCLTITVNDSYGDGMPFYDPAIHDAPGIEVTDLAGNVLKPAIEALNWESSISMETGVSAAASNTVDTEIVTGIQVSPNPVSTTMNVEFTSADVTNVAFSVMNNLGQVIDTRNVSVVNGNNVISFDTFNYDNGIYSLISRSDAGITTTKFIVAK